MAHTRQNSIDYLSVIMGAVVPENRAELSKQIKALFFPEEKYENLNYIKKAKDLFSKLRGVDLSITSIGG